jgi:hypothetical protein
MDKKPARNLFIICLALFIFLIVWIAMSSSTNPSGEGSFIADLKETIQSFQGIPQVDSPTKAVIVAETVFASRSRDLPQPQVVDVELLPFREAIMHVSGISPDGTGDALAEMPVWLVIFYTGSNTGQILVLTPGSNPVSSSSECTFVLVEPQKGVVFQSGLIHECGR